MAFAQPAEGVLRLGSPMVNWYLVADDDGVVLDARDDGHGVRRLELGNGLTGMSERVEHRGGEIRFDPGAGRGFGVTARIPAS